MIEVLCNCLAMRQAARHISQLYDQFLAPTGLRCTQFSILKILGTRGSISVNALAALLVMDRTTLGRNLLPLERAGLIGIGKKSTDRRQKEIRLSEQGEEKLREADVAWLRAQESFEEHFGAGRARELRALAAVVVAVPGSGPNRGVEDGEA